MTKEAPAQVVAATAGLLTVLATAPSYPAFWGFFGALVYGLTQLVAIYAAEGEVTPRAQKLAWTRLVIALIFGSFGAAAIAATAIRISGGSLDITSASFGVGLLGSGVWPTLEKLLKDQGPRLITGLKAFVGAVANEAPGPGSGRGPQT